MSDFGARFHSDRAFEGQKDLHGVITQGFFGFAGVSYMVAHWYWSFLVTMIGLVIYIACLVFRNHTRNKIADRAFEHETVSIPINEGMQAVLAQANKETLSNEMIMAVGKLQTSQHLYAKNLTDVMETTSIVSWKQITRGQIGFLFALATLIGSLLFSTPALRYWTDGWNAFVTCMNHYECP